MKGTYRLDEKTGEFVRQSEPPDEATLCKCGCGKMVTTERHEPVLHTGQYL